MLTYVDEHLQKKVVVQRFSKMKNF